MPIFVKGNQCVMASWQTVEMLNGGSSLRYISFPLGIAGSFTRNSMSMPMQAGRLKAVNVHVNTNTSDADVTYHFSKDVWNGAGWDARTDFLLFTVPAGEEGFFCSTLSETQTDTAWNPRDLVGVRQNRSTPNTGDYKDLTIGMCFEITETALVDTAGSPNR